MYYSRSNAKIFEDDTIFFKFEKQQILDRYSVDLWFANSLYNWQK
jgi:very-short-patch-repair endonuclease